MTKCRQVAPLAMLMLVLARPCLAWGVKGHDWTIRNAVELLPEGPLKQHLEDHLPSLRSDTLDPDFEWRDGSQEKLEAPNHCIDLELVADPPAAADIPRTRLDAMRVYAERGIAHRSGGFLPWRIEELYWELANAMKAGSGDVPFLAAILAHYATDATQPLHTTIHFDGRADRRVDGRKELQGLHVEYEVDFLEDHGIEFRESALALASPPERLADVHAATVGIIVDAHSHVDEIYEVAAHERGADRFAAWDRDMGDMTRGQLAKAATFVSSLWYLAWLEVGRPALGE